MIRLIKRYGSRKLYDTEESRYVSLDEIGTWVRAGQEMRVVDNTTDEDVTAQTLTQVILEEGRQGRSFVTPDLLHEIIRRGGEVVSSSVEQLQHRVDRVLQAGLERISPIRQMREETTALRARLEALEASLSEIESLRAKRVRPVEKTTRRAGSDNVSRVGKRKGVHP